MKKRPMAAVLASVLLASSLALTGCDFIDSITSFDFGGFVESVKTGFDDFMNPVSYDEGRQAQITKNPAAVAVPDIVKEGYLTVGIKTFDVIAPSYISNPDGTISGLDVDLASALADEMGLKVRFVAVDNIGEALGTTCDIVMDVAAGEDANATVVGQYEEQATAFFYRGDAVTRAAADLYGHSVGIQQGSVSQALLETSGLNMIQSPYTTLNEAFDALDAGVVEYVLCDAYPGAYLASSYDGISFAGTLDVPTSVGIGVSLTNTNLQNAVQTALDKVNSNGLMAIVRADWVGDMTNLSYANQIQVSTQ